MKKNNPKYFLQIISYFLIINFIFSGIGICSISPDQNHVSDHGKCLHFHQPGKETEHHEDSHEDCHHDDKDKEHNGGRIHCHTNQIMVCLNDFTIFISTLNYESFFENPLTSFISFISTRIDHIPIQSS